MKYVWEENDIVHGKFIKSTNSFEIYRISFVLTGELNYCLALINGDGGITVPTTSLQTFLSQLNSKGNMRPLTIEEVCEVLKHTC